MQLSGIPIRLLFRRLNASVCFPVVEQAADLFEGDGLRHEEIHAAGESFALVSAGREARQSDDQGRGGPVAVPSVVAARFLDVADGSGGFESVQHGHAYICRHFLDFPELERWQG